MVSKFIALVFGCAAIAACQNEVVVEVSQVGDDITFVAKRDDKPACIDEVTVYRADDQLKPLWTLGAPKKVPCQSEFRYGQDAAGFLTDGPPPKLQNGVKYAVSMRGAGQIGQGDFTKGQ